MEKALARERAKVSVGTAESGATQGENVQNFQRAKGSPGALKGGKHIGGKGGGKKGKGNKGYGYKGKDTGNNGGYYYNNYRSPGKGVGKGSNYMTEAWHNARESEETLDNYWEIGVVMVATNNLVTWAT